jgi:hypothetical protein
VTSTRLLAYTPNGASLGPIPAPQGLQVSFPLNDIGACTWTYPTMAPRVAVIGQPVEVAVEVSTDQGATWAEPANGRFLYLRDGRDPVKDDAYQIECPGYALRLRKGLVFNLSLDTDGKRHFTAASPGQILNTLMSEAQARGALTGITWAFTAANDSGGVAWPAATLQNIAYDPGTDILTILQAMADAGLVDYRFQGRALQLYPAEATMATDRTIGANPVSLRFGRDLVEAPFRRTWEALANVALVMGDNLAASIRTNGAALTPWGRQETFVTASGVTDTGTLATLGDGALSLTEAERVERTYGLLFDTAKFLPFRDYAPGEWVYGATDPDVAPTRMRVRQVTLTMDDAGVAGGNAVLNDRFVEADILQARRLDRIISGATQSGTGTTPSGAGNDILAPAAVGAVTGSTSAYLGDDGWPRAQITLDWADVTTNSDGTAATDIDHYEVHRRRQGDVTWTQVGEVNASTWSDSPYQPNEDWEFRVRAVDNVFNRGAFSGVAAVHTASDVTAPAKPSTPVLATTNTRGIIQVTWDGLTATAGPMDADLAYVEVHAKTVNNFTPTPGDTTTLVGRLTGAGSLTFAKPITTTQYVKLVAIDTSSNPSIPSNQATIVVSTGTDGAAPASSPTPVVIGGIRSLFVTWPAVTNADPVRYEVHASTTTGFAPSAGTKVTDAERSTSYVIRTMPDGSDLELAVPTYVRIIAKDDDGSAAVGAQASGTPMLATTADLAVESVTTDKLAANAVTADKFAGRLVLGSTITTGEDGTDRVVLDANGLSLIEGDGTIRATLPVNPATAAYLRGHAELESADITDNLTVLGANNALAAGAALILKGSTTDPTSQVAVAVDIPSTKVWLGGSDFTSGRRGLAVGASGVYVTANLFFGTQLMAWNEAGAFAGNVDLNTAIAGYTGTFQADGGVAYVGSSYYVLGWVHRTSDNKDVWQVRKFTVDFIAGTKALVAYADVGIHGADFNGTGKQPILGKGATTGLVLCWWGAATGGYKVTIQDINVTTCALSGAYTQYGTALTAGVIGDMRSVEQGSFDFGAARTVVSYKGQDTVLVYNGTALVTSEQFTAAPNHEGMAWSPVGDYTFRATINGGTNVYMYNHTGVTWTDTTTPTQTWWSSFTWRNRTNAAGSQWETAQSLVKAYTMNKRRRVTVSSPSIPPGGTSTDPDSVRFYFGRGVAQPARTAMWKNGDPGVGVTSLTLTAVLFSGTNPPAAGNFPGAVPAKITSADGTKYLNSLGNAVLGTLSVVALADHLRAIGAFLSNAAVPGAPAAAGVATNIGTVAVTLRTNRRYRVTWKGNLAPGTSGQWISVDLFYGVGATTTGTGIDAAMVDCRAAGRVVSGFAIGEFTWTGADNTGVNVVAVMTGQGGTAQTFPRSGAASRLLVEEIAV